MRRSFALLPLFAFPVSKKRPALESDTPQNFSSGFRSFLVRDSSQNGKRRKYEEPATVPTKKKKTALAYLYPVFIGGIGCEASVVGAMSLQIGRLFVLLLCGPCLGEIRQRVTLFEKENCGGIYETFFEACSDLSICGGALHNTTVMSVFRYGAWSYFEFPGFGGWITTIFGNAVCATGLTTFGRSLRFGGSSDLEEEGLTLYQESHYGGQDYFFNSNTTLFGDAVRSVITTGPSPWSFYEFPHFQGVSACVEPITLSGLVGYASDLRDLGLQTVGSFHSGCL